MNLKKLFMSATLFLAVACTQQSADSSTPVAGKYKPISAEVTIGTLLNEISSRDVIARYPEPEFITHQFSSYDRASKVKGGEGWYGNADCSQFLRYEEKDGRTEYVMFDAKGPGAITRWWMTFAGNNGGKGMIRVYIDDSKTPIISGSAFDILSGGRIVKGALGSSVSNLTPYEQRGHDLYYPIPYAKRCKITYESGNISHDALGVITSNEAVYYNIEYRTYLSTTKVASYSEKEAQYYAALANQVSTALSTVVASTTAHDQSLDGTLASGQQKSLTIEGPAAIKLITMRLQAVDINQALRSTILKIVFDGEQTVWIPVGEFFRVGYKPLEMRSWYVQCSADGSMTAYWVMPFKTKAVLTLVNAGTQEVSLLNSRVGYDAWTFDARSMYFGADWHQYSAVDTRKSPITGVSGSVYDINFTKLSGKGIYVGDGVTLYNTTAAWWGEGDEKVYVDGETFPSHFGTGSEDYFGYAWCRAERFSGHPFIAQPDGSGNLTPGYTTNTRFRCLDGISFKNGIIFDMELWHWAQCKINYAVTTFHYMLPGGRDFYGESYSDAQRKVSLSPIDILPLDESKFDLEAEYTTLDRKTGGNYEIQTAFSQLWSNGCQAFWSKAPVGSELVLGFDSPYSGSYSMTIQYARSWDYGRFDVWFNETKIESDTDMYSAEVKTEQRAYGNVELKKGRNTLRVVAKSVANGQTTAYFGVDKFIFVKQ